MGEGCENSGCKGKDTKGKAARGTTVSKREERMVKDQQQRMYEEGYKVNV
jgi:hypothetical protein